MKILYVTRDLRDGDFIEHELNRLVPHAQISVLPSADEIINRLNTLGQRDVVLIDQASLGNESLELLKKTRAAAVSAPHLLVLMGVADQNSPDQVVQAGADECVVKSAGYMERLARTIQRFAGTQERPAAPRNEDRMRLILEQMPACVVMIAPDGTILALNWAGLTQVGAQRLDQVVGRNLGSLLTPQARESFSVFLARVCAGQPSSLEFEWAGFDGVQRRQLLKGVPFNREPGSTAATLGVIYDLAPVVAAPQETPESDKSLEAAQTRCADLERELAEQQAAEVRVIDKIQALRAEWDGARQDLEKRVKDAEEQRFALAQLLESTRAAAAEETQERSRWETTLQQLEGRVAAAEGQCHTLEQALRVAETARKESADRLEAERSAWQAGVLAIEQKLRQSEEERTILNTALMHTEETRDAVSAALAAERERAEDVIRKLEESEKARALLESALEQARAAGQQQAAAFEQAAVRAAEERNGWDVVCRQLQEKLEAAAEAQSALEARLAHSLEVSDGQGQSEERRLAAEGELRAAREREFELSMAIENLQLEKAQWGTVQADLEERRILVEAERTSLQQALDEAGSVQARVNEELKSERAKLAAERAEREKQQKAYAQLSASADELAQSLEKAKTLQVELLQAREEDRNKLEELSRELERTRAAQTAAEAALHAHAAARALLTDQLASVRAEIESERQQAAQLRVEREHLRRQLLDTGKRYRELIRSRAESFRQTLNAGVTRLQQIAESRLALLAAQHREELERLQQLVREGNLRQQDLDTLLADGEQADRKLASGSSAPGNP